jgi:hypothetical protein
MIFPALLALAAAPSINVTERKPESADALVLSPSAMFSLAEKARRTGDIAMAQEVYRALADNPDIELRTEAKFRLAMLLSQQRRYDNAAILFRSILDEKPGAQRVRIEFAKTLALLGDEGAARRQLRAIRTGVLPPEVAQAVDRFSAALRAHKPIGASIQLAVASDSNINRSTRSDTLGTVIGDFTLSDDARAQSGHGLSAQAQGYARLDLGGDSDLLATLSGSDNLYRKSEFNDVSLGAGVGPEFKLGGNQLHPSVSFSRRWFGGARYTDAATAQLDIVRPLAATAQIRTTGAANRIWNSRNPLESGWSYSGSVGLEAALSTKAGAGFTLTGIRQALSDPGYSATSGQLSLFGYREAGKLTVTGSLTLGRLRADKRLLLYRDRRDEWLYRAKIGASARQVQFAGFAPTVQFAWERNRSPIEIYDYRRRALEFGVTRAF